MPQFPWLHKYRFRIYDNARGGLELNLSTCSVSLHQVSVVPKCFHFATVHVAVDWEISMSEEMSPTDL